MATKRTTRRLPSSYRTFKLDGEWVGWEFEANTRVPLGAYLRLTRDQVTLYRFRDLGADAGVDDVDAGAEALQHLVEFLRRQTRSWNFVDGDGDAFDVLQQEAWDALPMDIVGQMIGAVLMGISNVPLVNGSTSPGPLSEGT